MTRLAQKFREHLVNCEVNISYTCLPESVDGPVPWLLGLVSATSSLHPLLSGLWSRKLSGMAFSTLKTPSESPLNVRELDFSLDLARKVRVIFRFVYLGLLY